MPSESQPHPSGKDFFPLMGLQILVVESNCDTRELFTFAFEVQGATVIPVTSAAEALAAIEFLHPHLITSEIRLGDEDGCSLIQKVKSIKSGKYSGIPAIAVTTLASDHDRTEALAAGFQRYFTKPVDLDKLSAAVEQLAKHLLFPITPELPHAIVKD